jgi:hypothetical protein
MRKRFTRSEGDRGDAADSGHDEKFPDLLCGLLDPRLALAADAQGRLKDRDRRGDRRRCDIGAGATSSRSANSSASSGSRVRMATMAEASTNIMDLR